MTQKIRQDFILDHIRKKQYISRRVLKDKFSIERSQAKRDISMFKNKFPNLLKYNSKTGKHEIKDNI